MKEAQDLMQKKSVRKNFSGRWQKVAAVGNLVVDAL
jgi:hypothetical protein